MSGNELTSLDVSMLPKLYDLKCQGQGHQLATPTDTLLSLNVANGNNHNISTFGMRIAQNANLTCVQVDDVTYSDNTWNDHDVQTYFSTNC